MGSKLSKTLGFPDRFFERRPCVEFDAKAISFRARRTTTKRQRAAAISAGSFGIEVDLWISQRFGLPDVAVPDMTGESPRIAASLLRNFWGLGAKPLPNLVQLSESKGIRVNGLPDVAASVDAFSLWHGEIPHIFLAQRKTPERARFDLAHEIGHLLLHRRIGPESIEERQADEFASEFLVPTESIFERLRPNPTIDELMKAKRAFGVSAMALTYAVHKAGRMTDWIYRSTCCELARRGFRNGEPEGMTGYERSRVFHTFSPRRRMGRFQPRESRGNSLFLWKTSMPPCFIPSFSASDLQLQRPSPAERAAIRASTTQQAAAAPPTAAARQTERERRRDCDSYRARSGRVVSSPVALASFLNSKPWHSGKRGSSVQLERTIANSLLQ